MYVRVFILISGCLIVVTGTIVFIIYVLLSFAKMGAFFSCPLAKYIDVENGLESVTVKSISFGDDEVKTPVRSISFNSRDLEPMIMKSVGSGRMTLETSVSFKRRELEKVVSMEAGAVPLEDKLLVVADSPKSKVMENQSPRSENHDGIKMTMDLNPTNPKHIAAMKLQKVYKSFRTRRKLADCAVLVEQSWYEFRLVSLFLNLNGSILSLFTILVFVVGGNSWILLSSRGAPYHFSTLRNTKLPFHGGLEQEPELPR